MNRSPAWKLLPGNSSQNANCWWADRAAPWKNSFPNRRLIGCVDARFRRPIEFAQRREAVLQRQQYGRHCCVEGFRAGWQIFGLEHLLKTAKLWS